MGVDDNLVHVQFCKLMPYRIDGNLRCVARNRAGSIHAGLRVIRVYSTARIHKSRGVKKFSFSSPSPSHHRHTRTHTHTHTHTQRTLGMKRDPKVKRLVQPSSIASPFCRHSSASFSNMLLLSGYICIRGIKNASEEKKSRQLKNIREKVRERGCTKQI